MDRTTLTRLDDIAEKLTSVLEQIDARESIACTNLLRIRINNPQSFVVLIGATNSGKSTILNGLMKREILPVSKIPTTGSITQIILSDDSETKYYAINSDGTKEELREDLFRSLSKESDENLLRLQLKIKSPSSEIVGMNIFDTPGFGSLNEKHDKTLFGFISDSDFVVFVVSSKDGLDIESFNNACLIQETLQNDKGLPILLAINFVTKTQPNYEARIEEIRKGVSDALHRKDLKTTLIETIMPRKDDSGEYLPVLPDTQNIMSEIYKTVSSTERKQAIFDKLKANISFIIIQNIETLNTKTLAYETTQKDKEYITEKLDEFCENENESIEIVEETFTRMQHILPKILSNSLKEKWTEFHNYIDSQGDFTGKDSCIRFINNYKFEREIESSKKDLQNNIKVELEDMDTKLQDLANTALKNFNDDIKIHDKPELNNLTANLSIRLGTEILKNSLYSMAERLGGVGGRAAGLGNMAKMATKNIGNLFGKTFSSETYTNIGSFFTKSTVLTLGGILTGAIQSLTVFWEASTWKNKYKSKIDEQLPLVLDNVLSGLQEYLKELKAKNITSVKNIYSDKRNDIIEDLNELEGKSGEYKKLVELKSQLLGLKNGLKNIQ